MRLPSPRRVLAFLLIAPFVVALYAIPFALWHSGHAGEVVCFHDASGGPGTLSWVPPGARCLTQGEESRMIVRLEATPLIGSTLVLAALAGIALGLRRLWRGPRGDLM